MHHYAQDFLSTRFKGRMQIMKKSWIFVGLLVIGVLAASFVGGNWTTGHAETVPTVPTIPVVTTVNPGYFRVGGPTLEITVTGANFIDMDWTAVRWLGPDGQILFLTTTFVSADGMTLKATVSDTLLTEKGKVYLWVVNHPGGPDQYELAGPLSLAVTEAIYVPVVRR
jgi:hypothetical protein